MEEGGKDGERNGDMGTEVEEIEIDDESKEGVRERWQERGEKRSTLPPSGLSGLGTDTYVPISARLDSMTG